MKNASSLPRPWRRFAAESHRPFSRLFGGDRGRSAASAHPGPRPGFGLSTSARALIAENLSPEWAPHAGRWSRTAGRRRPFWLSHLYWGNDDHVLLMAADRTFTAHPYFAAHLP